MEHKISGPVKPTLWVWTFLSYFSDTLDTHKQAIYDIRLIKKKIIIIIMGVKGLTPMFQLSHWDMSSQWDTKSQYL